MKCFFDLPPAVRRDLVDFKDGVARQFWMGRVENEFFTKGVSRCHCVLGSFVTYERIAQNTLEAHLGIATFRVSVLLYSAGSLIVICALN